MKAEIFRRGEEILKVSPPLPPLPIKILYVQYAKKCISVRLQISLSISLELLCQKVNVSTFYHTEFFCNIYFEAKL